MAKFSCEIKKLLVLGADPSFLYKKKRVCCQISTNRSLAEIFSKMPWFPQRKTIFPPQTRTVKIHSQQINGYLAIFLADR